MRHHGSTHGRPRIDVKIARRAVETFRTQFHQGHSLLLAAAQASIGIGCGPTTEATKSMNSRILMGFEM